jgi:hypothetical protein
MGGGGRSEEAESKKDQKSQKELVYIKIPMYLFFMALRLNDFGPKWPSLRWLPFQAQKSLEFRTHPL